jgi:nifR3 family TIM-barrel protein
VGEGLPLTVIQLLGADAEAIAAGARMAEAAGADIVDLNMGCPAKEVVGVRCGSALMRDLDLAEGLLRAAVGATGRPVTVKMRLGWDDAERNAPELARRAEAAGVAAVTVHGRTRQQLYGGRADWEAVAAVKAAVGLPVIVNGDVADLASARAALAQSGADGIMLGRAALGRPWLAAALDRGLGGSGLSLEGEPDRSERLAIVMEHLALSLSFYGDDLGLRVFRKHLGAYIEAAPWPASPQERRAAKAQICRLQCPRAVEDALGRLWEPTARRAA